MKNFWIEPILGFNDNNKGVSDDQIKTKEKELGVILPSVYCKLMKLQNGGNVRCQSVHNELVKDDEDYFPVIENIEPIQEGNRGVASFYDFLVRIEDEDDVEDMAYEYSKIDLKKLIVFARIEGGGCLAFDYGYDMAAVLKDPKIVVIEENGGKFFGFEPTYSLDNFEVFRESLTLEHNAVFVGIETSNTLQRFIELLQEKWNFKADTNTNTRKGLFNFDKWYKGVTTLEMDDEIITKHIERTKSEPKEMWDWIEKEGRQRQIESYFSPNITKAGTYLFPDDKNYNIIIEIKKTWFNTNVAAENLCKQLVMDKTLNITDAAVLVAPNYD